MEKQIKTMPVIALKGTVILPGIFVHLDIRRDISQKAAEEAMAEDGMVFLTNQKDEKVELPLYQDLRAVGVVAKIRQVFRLDEDMKPYLLMLSKNYTMYPLHNIIKMKTKYGIMLYELLKSAYFKGSVIEFEVQELKESLDCVSYENFSNFRKKVILPAIEDINTYTELKVDVDFKKTGRSFSHVIFTMTDLNKSKSPKDKEEAARRFYNIENEIYQISLFDKEQRHRLIPLLKSIYELLNANHS